MVMLHCFFRPEIFGVLQARVHSVLHHQACDVHLDHRRLRHRALRGGRLRTGRGKLLTLFGV